MRTLRFGSIGDDVRIVQDKLNDLGYYLLALDGRFGPGTETAVKRFQADRGLTADGIVGPDTIAALGIADTVGSPGGTGNSSTGGETTGRRKMSLHIGVNRVDALEYNGWDGALSGCENDADTMLAIATSEGFRPRQLLSEEATSANILAGIAEAAGQLAAGDTFLLTYAGHGGQLPDSGGDEVDRQDETWVLYDRMLIDDELEAAFSGFAPGTEIIMFSDSCHSGTVFRSMFSPEQQVFAELKESFYLDVVSPPHAQGISREASPGGSFPRPASTHNRGEPNDGRLPELFQRALTEWGGELGATRGYSWRDYVPPQAQSRGPGEGPQRVPGALATAMVRDIDAMESNLTDTVVVRAMPLPVNADVVVRHARQYADLKESVRSRNAVRAHGVAVSGCEDAQLSQEVGGHGVFTTAVKAIWAQGDFAGSYGVFRQQILPHMGPTQTPQLSGFGTDPDVLMARTPFD